MTITELAGRLICPVLPDVAQGGTAEILEDLQAHGWGGYVVFRRSLDLAQHLEALQRKAPHPLLIAADIESGTGQQVAGATHLPSLMAIGATGSEDLAYEAGRITATEACAVGLNWAFAPVVDVNVNVNNPIVNIRSFGEDPHLVARLGAAWVRGAQDHGLMATAKHFPGHGDTTVDSHSQLPVVNCGRDRLDRVELAPFRACIAAGVKAIMTAHVAFPALDSSGLPATLSKPIITGVLRELLGFEGLIVTDALIMGGITSSFAEEFAVVSALEAGCDMLLMPRDPISARDSLVRAVEGGKVSEFRIRDAVARIEGAVGRLGITRGIHGVDFRAHREFPRRVAAKALTLLRDPGVLPLGPQDFAVMIDDDGDLSYDGPLARLLDRNGIGWGIIRAGMDARERAGVLDRARGARAILVPIFSQIRAWKGRCELPEDLADVVREMVREGSKVLAVSFSNPYLLNQFPGVAGYVCAYGASADTQEATMAALLGEAASFPGTIPVTVDSAAFSAI